MANKVVWKLPNRVSGTDPHCYSGDVITVKITTRDVTLKIKQDSPSVENEIQLKAKAIGRPVQRKYELDEDNSKLIHKGITYSFDQFGNFTDDGSVIACLKIECKYEYRKLQRKILKLPQITIPIELPNMSGDVHLSQIEIALSHELNGSTTEDQKLKFIFRRVKKYTKFEKFMEWQHNLVYGRGIERYKDGAFRSDDPDGWHLKVKGKNKKLMVSATGNEGDYGASVCSTLTGIFFAYWLNYNQYYTAASGTSRSMLAAPTGELREKRNADGFVVDGEYKKPNGYGNFFTLLSYSGGVFNEINDFQDTFDLANDPDQHRWKAKDFYELALNEEDGTIYTCASKGHVWMVFKLGDKINCQQKYIFNNGSDDPCEKGLYKIQANGPGPGAFLFDDYSNYNKIINKRDLYLSRSQLENEINEINTKIDLLENDTQTRRDEINRDKGDRSKKRKIQDNINSIKANNKKIIQLKKKRKPKINKLNSIIDDEAAINRAGSSLDNLISIIDQVIVSGKTKFKFFNGSPLVDSNGQIFHRVTNKAGRDEVKYLVNFGKVLTESGDPDLSGEDRIKTYKGTFWVWRLKDVIDDETGLISKAAADNLGITLPEKMWRTGDRNPVEGVKLTRQDIREFK